MLEALMGPVVRESSSAGSRLLRGTVRASSSAWKLSDIAGGLVGADLE
jgi:hypothetical protein